MDRNEETVDVDQIRARVSKLTTIVMDVEKSDAWSFAMEEIESLITELDQNWQALNHDDFRKAQISKQGLMAVTTLVDSWRDELAQLEEDLFAYENPDKVQIGDYDGETNIGDLNGN